MMSDQVVLVVDVGNSRTKVSVVRGADCVVLGSLVGGDISGAQMESLIAQYDPQGAIVCTSRGHVAGALTSVLESFFEEDSGFDVGSVPDNGSESDNGSAPGKGIASCNGSVSCNGSESDNGSAPGKSIASCNGSASVDGTAPINGSALRGRRPRKLIYLSHLTPIPLVNTYKTPATLGMDRLAASVGAAHLAPGFDLMVVDLGTALTIDFVNGRGEYLGGVISPGMNMRFRALHEMTGTLPLCQKSPQAAPLGPEHPHWGGSTKEAIERGVIQGMALEIEGYAQKSGCEKIFFTGGDSFYFAERVKCAIFANCELVTIGLNQIFRYNAESKTE